MSASDTISCGECGNEMESLKETINPGGPPICSECEEPLDLF